MASQTVLKGLKQVLQKPLSTLNQGASLSIRSHVPLASLQILSQWRDDGRVSLTQHKASIARNDKGENLFLTISQTQDRMTSLGRSASHVALDLHKNKPNSDESSDIYKLSSANDAEPISQESADTGTIHKDSNEYGVHLSVIVPEKVNLDIRLEQGGSICVPEKVEGDVDLSTSDGAIKVKKLRGHKVRLESFGQNALVYASGLLEAQELSVMSSGRFRAKQIHGSSVEVRISHKDPSRPEYESLEQDDDGAIIDVSSLYVPGHGGATLTVQSAELEKKAVRVKTIHGPVRVTVDGACQPTATDANTNEFYPLVELGGVNGNFEVSTQNTVVKDGQDWKSCLVHVDSLSPDSVSLLSTDAGDISLTVDRKVESDLRCLTTTSKDCLTEASAMLAEEEDSDLVLDIVRNIPSSPSNTMNIGSRPNINIATKAFTENPGKSFHSSHVHYVDGWVDNNSAEPPSRFDRKVRGETAKGKINRDSAAEQALHGFGKSKSSEDKTSKEFPRPLMAVVGTAAITLETVSWLGAIARRYGLDESGRDVGRQASRRGRPLQPPTQNE